MKNLIILILVFFSFTANSQVTNVNLTWESNIPNAPLGLGLNLEFNDKYMAYANWKGGWKFWETNDTKEFSGVSQGERTGCMCNDGTYSSATGSGACSGHGGVNYWIYADGAPYSFEIDVTNFHNRSVSTWNIGFGMKIFEKNNLKLFWFSWNRYKSFHL